MAGKLFNIPLRGTHAHSWVMASTSEKKAFSDYLSIFPERAVLLIDTYNTSTGLENAIDCAKDLRTRGKELYAVRLDSGDLLTLSQKVRKRLDEEGFSKVKIVASGDLDELKILSLKKKKAPISIWGVGTQMVTGGSQAALDGVYKLAALWNEKKKAWDYRFKVSDNKQKDSLPGLLQVKRLIKDETYIADIIYDEVLGCSKDENPYLLKSQEKINDLSFDDSKDLLLSIFEKGKLIYKSPSLNEQRAFLQKELRKFKSQALDFKKIASFLVATDKNLYNLKCSVESKIEESIL